MTGRAAVVGAGTAMLVAAATASLPIDLRAIVVLVVTALVTLGCRWQLAELTATGLVGVVALVGSGPAATSGPAGIVAWAAATWLVVLAATRASDADRPPARDVAARARSAAGPLLACIGSVPLAVLVSDGDRVPAIWATAAGLGLVILLALGLIALGRRRAHRRAPAGER